jgi:Flp pilus assembly protein TadB
MPQREHPAMHLTPRHASAAGESNAHPGARRMAKWSKNVHRSNTRRSRAYPGTFDAMGVRTIDDGSRFGAGRWRWTSGDVKVILAATLAAVMLMGVVLRFWVLIVAVAIVAVALWLIHDGSMQRQARRELDEQRRADLRSRADAEHQAFLRGERRGLYGQYDPPEL